MGTATTITGNQIVVRTGAGTNLLYADKETKVWRGKTGSVLSVVQPGDQVLVRFRQDSSGRSVILDLYANITHVWGRISKVTDAGFEVDQNFNADPQSAYRRRYRQITFDSDTRFEESTPANLVVGRTVDVIGLKTTELEVVATRITVYEGRRPVGMRPNSRVTLPNGTIQVLK
jgi:hypothetical protein